MTNEQEKKKPLGKWLAFIAMGLITVSLISFSNSMDDIENLVDIKTPQEYAPKGLRDPEYQKINPQGKIARLEYVNQKLTIVFQCKTIRKFNVNSHSR